MQARLKLKTDRPDIMSYILAHNDASPDTRMSEPEMEFNSMALTIAGSETLTATLSGTLSYLLRSPKQIEKLVLEIRSSFQTEAEISAQSSKSLPYLTAVLQEGLRVCPPIPDTLRRAVPRGGAVIVGHALPEGVTIGVLCYTAFHSAANFSSPDDFIPERWLGFDARFSGDKHGASHPFSLGPHNYIGQALAW